MKVKDFNYWSERFINRSDIFDETPRVDSHYIKFEFKDKILLNFSGDKHIGSPYVDYERIRDEASVEAKTPNSYHVEMGDIVDGFFFNPAQMEQIEQPPEQFKYAKSLLKYYGENKKLLVGVGGDHDLWAEKYGNSFYDDFKNDTGGIYMHGVSFLEFKVGSQTYKITVAHRTPGNSMYNKTHGAMRLYKDSSEGSDIVVTAHNHQKGHTRQAIREFGGISRMVDYVSVGAYKSEDDYSRKMGFGIQAPEEMFGCSIVLYPDKKLVRYYDDIIMANKEFIK